MTRAVEVVAAGVSTTVQDLGRPGFGHLGVSPAGAVDPQLAGRTNALVGNDRGAAVIETAAGLHFRAVGPLVIATSAEALPRSLHDGEEVTLPADPTRRWQYVAVRGGLAVSAVLGSRSFDTMAGLGPAPPVDGDRLPVGPEPDRPVLGEPVPAPAVRDVVRIEAGPRADWLADGAVELLTAVSWRVGPSNRVGTRLSGPKLAWAATAELPSEGLVRGAIQVPPDGQPVVMLADHPTTGGYPVVAVVRAADVGNVGQLPDGSRLRFRR